LLRDWSIRGLAIAGLVTLGACAPLQNGYLPDHNGYLADYAEPHPTPSDFRVCHGYGCKLQTRIALGEAEWRRVRAAFQPPAASASGEQRQIAAAIATLETEVGQRTGTSAHQRRELNTGDASQLDCIDESVNTWTFLTMLDSDGLIRLHRVASIAHGGSLIRLDMRNTAVIEQKATGVAYAVDPWLVDAGNPPPIFPLSIWLASWPPQVPGDMGSSPQQSGNRI
jgi:hypothetical protein